MLTRLFGGKALVIAGCLVGAVAMSILAFAHAYPWEIYLSGAIMGIGFGLAFSAMSALVVAAVGTVHPGVTTGDISALVWAMRRRPATPPRRPGNDSWTSISRACEPPRRPAAHPRLQAMTADG